MEGSPRQYQARSTARRKALQILFQSEMTGQDSASILAEGLCIDEVGIPCDFTRLLLEGVGSNSTQIDDIIAQTSENWSLDRMPLVDRSILRIATFEMLRIDEIPCSVTINEAVELAKSFGGEDESPRFVNGVLGRIASHLGETSESNALATGTKAKSKREKREKKVVHG